MSKNEHFLAKIIQNAADISEFNSKTLKNGPLFGPIIALTRENRPPSGPLRPGGSPNTPKSEGPIEGAQ